MKGASGEGLENSVLPVLICSTHYLAEGKVTYREWKVSCLSFQSSGTD